MSKLTWPAWFNSPNGAESAIFNRESDVPRGWTSGAEKLTVEGMSAPAPAPVPAPVPAPAPAPLAGVIDAQGHTFDPAMHTGTMTKAGLWRMKVGVARPAPIQHDL